VLIDDLYRARQKLMAAFLVVLGLPLQVVAHPVEQLIEAKDWFFPHNQLLLHLYLLVAVAQG
jgi:hypothetical protein